MTTELGNWRELADTTKLAWPEWEAKDATGCAKANDRLRTSAGEFCVARFRVSDDVFLCWLHSITDHEAECLFERHARRFLEERGWEIRQTASGYNAFKHGCDWGKFATIKDYAAALQDAVRAADKEGKSDADKD